MNFWQDKSVLITGGTGSLGSALVKELTNRTVRKIIIYSRDELKQFEMRQRINDDRLRFFLGDVRDKDRLNMSFENVNVVIHTAALKQVSSGEYNPFEFVKTNIAGSQNVVEAAIKNNVEFVLGISSDKASGGAINLYGATKLIMERLFIQGKVYSGQRNTKFSCVRYGNVIGSRGSLIRVFQEQMKAGKITVTDFNATRFWITMPQAVNFVLSSIEMMRGGEIFIPKLKASDVATVYKAMDKDALCKVDIIGLRNGEKMHETLISNEELCRTEDMGDRFVIDTKRRSISTSAYVSNLVEQISVEEVRQLIDTLQ